MSPLIASTSTKLQQEHPIHPNPPWLALAASRCETVGTTADSDAHPNSRDTKNKELVGDFKNAGREWHLKGEPERVQVHDFKDKQLGKAIPDGVYDIATDQGWVPAALPQRSDVAHHRRLRRFQRQPRPPLESRAAKAR